MTRSCIGKQAGLAVACALALGMMATAARAQAGIETTGYLTDGQGAVVTSGFGLCWRAAGPAPSPTPACAPDYLAPTVVRRRAPPARPGPVATLTPPPAPRHAPIQSFALRPAAPELPAIQKVVLDAEALFALDSAELTAAGRTALDDFLVRLGQIGPGTIRLIGHADRLGTQAHNQLLSERRAQTVKDYLVSKGIDPLRLLAEGRGETQPVTRTGACDGGRSARVIACLQADRRVAIEVAGTRSIR